MWSAGVLAPKGPGIHQIHFCLRNNILFNRRVYYDVNNKMAARFPSPSHTLGQSDPHVLSHVSSKVVNKKKANMEKDVELMLARLYAEHETVLRSSLTSTITHKKKMAMWKEIVETVNRYVNNI